MVADKQISLLAILKTERRNCRLGFKNRTWFGRGRIWVAAGGEVAVTLKSLKGAFSSELSFSQCIAYLHVLVRSDACICRTVYTCN